MYGLCFTADPGEFLFRVEDFLASRPVAGNVLATIADRAVREQSKGIDRRPGPWWFLTVRDASQAVVGAAMRTAPAPLYPLWVQDMPAEAARQLARTLNERGEFIGGINGALPSAEIVAAESARLRGRRTRVSTSTRLFELATLLPPSGVPGRLRQAHEEDVEIVHRWRSRFAAEAAAQAGRPPEPEPAAEIDPAETRRQVVDDGTIWLWEDGGEIVHLTAAKPPSFGVARIGPVFTPAQHRGRGYASAAVAAVSKPLHDAGVRVCLFTDRANPTSNAIYPGIGFRPVTDMAEFVID
jgi:RimJ/RimL family protein N-acetyltransferase